MDGKSRCVKLSLHRPGQACRGRKCSRKLKLSGLLDNKHMKVTRLLDLRPGHHYPLVLFSVRGRKQLGSRLCYSDSVVKKKNNTAVHNNFAKDLSLA